MPVVAQDELQTIKGDRARLVLALKDAGATVKGDAVNCPFHRDHNASGAIHDRNGSGWRFTCHACVWNGNSGTGDLLDVVQKSHRCDFAGACEILGIGSAETPVIAPAGRKGATRTDDTAGNGRAAPGRVYESVEEFTSTLGNRAGGAWLYEDIDGAPAMAVVRINEPDGGKKFLPFHPVPGGWAIGDPIGKLPLYGSPELSTTTRIWVFEGEHCVDVARGIGLNATTSSHGAGSAGKTDWGHLAGCDVVLVPDHDEAGRAYVKTVCGILAELDPPARVKIIELSGFAEHEDFVDYIENKDSVDGGDIRRAIEELADAAPWHEPIENAPQAEVDATTVHRTDMGNARRFALMFASRAKHAPGAGWLAWEGKRWERDRRGVVSLAKQYVRSLYAAASDIGDKKERTSAVTFALQCESRKRIADMLTLAESEPSIAIDDDSLDADPWLLNVDNGILDLRKIELRPHDSAAMLTKITRASYHADAPATRWRAFVNEIMDGDSETIAYLQRLAGYSIVGTVEERSLPIFHGAGSNGKSTFLWILSEALGDYATTTPPQTLLSKRDTIPNDIAKLRGARFVTCIETTEGRKLDAALVKAMTGGDTLSARFMRAEWFEFDPQCTIFLATNHKPVIDDDSDAMWDRVSLIPFNRQFPEGQRDKRLKEKLTAELDGIFAWIVEGCVDWQRRGGLEPPESVRVASREYRSEEDTIRSWIADCCVISPDVQATGGELRESYERWAKDSGGFKPVGPRAFGQRLKADYRDTRGRRVTYHGIGLLQPT